jgi:hypothetical protein
MLQSPGGQGALADADGRLGILDHYVDSLEWQLPRAIWLGGTSLGFDARPQPGKLVRPGPGMLEDFVKLADARDQAILKYARKWGPLWACGHRCYWQHNRFGCRPVESSDDQYYTRWEPLDYWRDFAKEARATLRIAHKLNSGQPGDPEDWRAIPGRYDRMDGLIFRWDELQWISPDQERIHEATLIDDDLETLERTLIELKEEQQSKPDYISTDDSWQWETLTDGATPDIHERMLSVVLDRWVERGCVKLSVFRQNGRRAVRLGGGGLLGALAVQLIFDVCRTDGLAVCTSCGTPYLPPTRRPRRDQNPYCPDCGLKAAMRDAAARYRKTEKYRQARERRLARDKGLT